MPSSVGTSGGNKTIAAITVGTASGNKAVQVGYVGTSGGNKVFFSALSASASPLSVSGFGGGVPGTTTSDPTTATPAGGIGPYTYAWARLSGDVMTADASTSATTTFSAGVGVGLTRSAIYGCTVTDTATGLSVQLDANVSVLLDNT